MLVDEQIWDHAGHKKIPQTAIFKQVKIQWLKYFLCDFLIELGGDIYFLNFGFFEFLGRLKCLNDLGIASIEPTSLFVNIIVIEYSSFAEF